LSDGIQPNLYKWNSLLPKGDKVAFRDGVKFDTEKIRPELFPPDAFEALCDLYARGARKYGDRNWEKGMSWGRLFGALMRHAWAWWRGESYDPELNTNHMLNVAWNAIGLYVYETRKIGTDDRPK
jgi:hypothetical protein